MKIEFFRFSSFIYRRPEGRILKLDRFHFSLFLYIGRKRNILVSAWKQIFFVFGIPAFSFLSIYSCGENRSFWNWPVLLFLKTDRFRFRGVFIWGPYSRFKKLFKTTPIIYTREILKLDHGLKNKLISRSGQRLPVYKMKTDHFRLKCGHPAWPGSSVGLPPVGPYSYISFLLKNILINY